MVSCLRAQDRMRYQDPKLIRHGPCKNISVTVGKVRPSQNVGRMMYLAYRNVSRLMRGETLGPEGSISNLSWSELDQWMNGVRVDVAEAAGALTEDSSHAIRPLASCLNFGGRPHSQTQISTT
jgi:hypothetical protein